MNWIALTCFAMAGVNVAYVILASIYFAGTYDPWLNLLSAGFCLALGLLARRI